MTRLWLIIVAIGIVMLIAGYAAAAEITGPRWQLWEQPPGQDWRPRGKQLNTSTACDLDAASLAMVVEKATRIASRAQSGTVRLPVCVR